VAVAKSSFVINAAGTELLNLSRDFSDYCSRFNSNISRLYELFVGGAGQNRLVDGGVDLDELEFMDLSVDAAPDARHIAHGQLGVPLGAPHQHHSVCVACTWGDPQWTASPRTKGALQSLHPPRR
jgi:hypothetical protein